MDYRFTAILIIMFICLTLFAKPAYPKNEYLNNGTNTCSTGSVEASIEKEDRNNDTDIIIMIIVMIITMRITEQR